MHLLKKGSIIHLRENKAFYEIMAFEFQEGDG